MNDEGKEFKRLNVEGVDPVLFQQFKLICVERDVSIKEVVHEFLRAYVKQALKEFEKKERLT
ncbi:hypothetical protein ES703_77945 [subsurface metagenome]